MAKRVATAIALMPGLLALSPAAPGQLPPAIQPDRLQVLAELEAKGETMNCMGSPAQDGTRIGMRGTTFSLRGRVSS